MNRPRPQFGISDQHHTPAEQAPSQNRTEPRKQWVGARTHHMAGRVCRAGRPCLIALLAVALALCAHGGCACLPRVLRARLLISLPPPRPPAALHPPCMPSTRPLVRGLPVTDEAPSRSFPLARRRPGGQVQGRKQQPGVRRQRRSLRGQGLRGLLRRRGHVQAVRGARGAQHLGLFRRDSCVQALRSGFGQGCLRRL